MKTALMVLGYLWSLPHSLAGLLFVIVYRPTSARWSSGCLEFVAGTKRDGRTRIWGRPGAQTHGAVIFYASESIRLGEGIRVHERVHVLQGFVGGVFYVLAYGLSFAAIFAWLHMRRWFSNPPVLDRPAWKVAYLAIPFERQARRITQEYLDGKRPEAWR